MTDLSTPLPPAVTIIGLGLIGGSLMRAAAPLLPVSGWSPSEETRQSAAAAGYKVTDSLDRALFEASRNDSLVVLAAPVSEFGRLLSRIGAGAPEVLLTDVGGVKGPVADAVAERAPRARYIGSHPMTGTQFSGWRSGSPDLFIGKAWVTCPSEDTASPDWAVVAGLALSVGSRVVPCEAAAHDAAVARISHLPHLLALVLAQAGAAGGELALSLAAGSFADGTRVAATRPELIQVMGESNRWPLLDAVDDALGILGVARGSLASTGALAKLTEAGHKARLQFENRGGELHPVTLCGPDLIEELLAIGPAGGHVSAISQAGDDLKVEAWYPTID